MQWDSGKCSKRKSIRAYAIVCLNVTLSEQSTSQSVFSVCVCCVSKSISIKAKNESHFFCFIELFFFTQVHHLLLLLLLSFSLH